MSVSSSTRITFIGLGVMGAPMAGHLARAGHTVTVYNRTAAKAQQWLDAHRTYAVAQADTPAAAAAGADVVICCVGNDDDLRAVVLGPEGALAAMRPGALLIDHTTASAQVARELHATCAANQVGFVDAPVSGGNLGAINGTLTVMCGGDADDCAQAAGICGAYARAVSRIGDAGAGQLTKMVNQICVAGLLQGLAEGLAFGVKAGLPMAQVVELLSQGAAQSWQMQHRGPTMLREEFDFGFAVDWMHKDLQLCLAEAERVGAPLPVTAVVDRFYAELQQAGDGRLDTSSLIKRLL